MEENNNEFVEKNDQVLPSNDRNNNNNSKSNPYKIVSIILGLILLATLAYFGVTYFNNKNKNKDEDNNGSGSSTITNPYSNLGLTEFELSEKYCKENKEAILAKIKQIESKTFIYKYFPENLTTNIDCTDHYGNGFTYSSDDNIEGGYKLQYYNYTFNLDSNDYKLSLEFDGDVTLDEYNNTLAYIYAKDEVIGGGIGKEVGSDWYYLLKQETYDMGDEYKIVVKNGENISGFDMMSREQKESLETLGTYKINFKTRTYKRIN